MSAPILQAQGVSVKLGNRTIVEDADVSLGRGELVILVGPNGAGKTTLMRALAALLPAHGQIALEGRPLGGFSARERARKLAYLPQGHSFHWPMPVERIVALGRYPHADPFSPPTAADNEAVERALIATATDGLALRPVTSLSGGERARVALARALATDAPVLLADEPTMSLDARHQLVVMGLLRKAAHDGGAILAVIHDLSLAARFADRVLVMQDGRIVADARPGDALTTDRIASVFGVDAIMVEMDGQTIPIAHRPL